MPKAAPLFAGKFQHTVVVTFNMPNGAVHTFELPMTETEWRQTRPLLEGKALGRSNIRGIFSLLSWMVRRFGELL